MEFKYNWKNIHVSASNDRYRPLWNLNYELTLKPDNKVDDRYRPLWNLNESIEYFKFKLEKDRYRPLWNLNVAKVIQYSVFN